MRSFRSGLAVVALCVAMLAGGGKSAAISRHSRAKFDDDVITTIINAIIQLDSRISIPPG